MGSLLLINSNYSEIITRLLGSAEPNGYIAASATGARARANAISVCSPSLLSSPPPLNINLMWQLLQPANFILLLLFLLDVRCIMNELMLLVSLLILHYMQVTPMVIRNMVVLLSTSRDLPVTILDVNGWPKSLVASLASAWLLPTKHMLLFKTCNLTT
jgi:hypothetical protein